MNYETYTLFGPIPDANWNKVSVRLSAADAEWMSRITNERHCCVSDVLRLALDFSRKHLEDTLPHRQDTV